MLDGDLLQPFDATRANPAWDENPHWRTVRWGQRGTIHRPCQEHLIRQCLAQRDRPAICLWGLRQLGEVRCAERHVYLVHRGGGAGEAC